MSFFELSCRPKVVLVTVIMWMVLAAGCSHLTVAPKPVTSKAIAFSGSKQNAGIIDCDCTGCLVDSNFLAKYKQMEADAKNYIQDDSNIKKEGNNWRVSYEVISHFTSLKAAERGV